jgi:hypothetical protein
MAESARAPVPRPRVLPAFESRIRIHDLTPVTGDGLVCDRFQPYGTTVCPAFTQFTT